MSTEPITAEMLEAAPLGTTIIRGVNGPTDRITEVLAVKADADGSPWRERGMEWWSDHEMARRISDDACLLYPALPEPARDEPVKVSGATVNPVDEWLAMDSSEMAARISHTTIEQLRDLRALVVNEADRAVQTRDAADARRVKLTGLESRIISLAAI